MKRKTVIIVGLTGTLLAGTALTGFMVNAYLGSQKLMIMGEIRSSNSPQYIQAQPAPAPVPARRSRELAEIKVK